MFSNEGPWFARFVFNTDKENLSLFVKWKKLIQVRWPFNPSINKIKSNPTSKFWNFQRYWLMGIVLYWIKVDIQNHLTTVCKLEVWIFKEIQKRRLSLFLWQLNNRPFLPEKASMDCGIHKETIFIFFSLIIFIRVALWHCIDNNNFKQRGCWIVIRGFLLAILTKISLSFLKLIFAMPMLCELLFLWFYFILFLFYFIFTFFFSSSLWLIGWCHVFWGSLWTLIIASFVVGFCNPLQKFHML